MPPPERQPTDSDHLLPAHKKSVGPTFAIIIILLVLIIGAVYFWNIQMNQPTTNQAPYIPAGTSTLPTATTSL